MFLSIQNVYSSVLDTETKPELVMFVDIALLDRNKQLTGMQQKLSNVIDILTKESISFEILYLPWKRILREAAKIDNALIFDIVKTPARSTSYHWLHILDEDTLYLYGLNKFRTLVESRETAVSHKHKAACEVGTVQCNILKKFGFKHRQILYIPSSSNSKLEELIFRGRADFMLGYNSTVTRHLIELNKPPNSMAPLLEVSKTVEYLAAPITLRSDLLIRLTKAFKEH